MDKLVRSLLLLEAALVAVSVTVVFFIPFWPFTKVMELGAWACEKAGLY